MIQKCPICSKFHPVGYLQRSTHSSRFSNKVILVDARAMLCPGHKPILFDSFTMADNIYKKIGKYSFCKDNYNGYELITRYPINDNVGIDWRFERE